MRKHYILEEDILRSKTADGLGNKAELSDLPQDVYDGLLEDTAVLFVNGMAWYTDGDYSVNRGVIDFIKIPPINSNIFVYYDEGCGCG